MRSCAAIDPLVTPFVDGELAVADRLALEEHLRICAPCHSRVEAERAVRTLVVERKPAFDGCRASAALRARCQTLCGATAAGTAHHAAGRLAWWRRRERVMPLAMAATLTLAVAGVLLYQATARSASVLAAELTADHVKCFALNAVLRTHDSPEAVETAMLSGFDWRIADAARSGALELVGSRPCLYGEGQMAHIMFRHEGRPVSLFMLPRSERPQEIVRTLGHEAAIWSYQDRTFVLVAREERADVERMAALMQASLQ
jgi:anti-sigma factor RsiW